MQSKLMISLLLSAPAWGADQSSRPGVPGTLNYVEGQVSLDGQTLGPEVIGSTVAVEDFTVALDSMAVVGEGTGTKRKD